MDYTGLQVAVADFLNRADVLSQVPTFIAMAEAKLSRRLRVRQMVTNSTASIANEFELTPTDFAAPISMKLSDSTVLDCISPDAMAWRKNQGEMAAGKPRHYSVVGSSFEFAPAPDEAFTAFLVYYAGIPALSLTAPSNWLLAGYPDIYLNGALQAAGHYLKDQRTALWGELFEAGIGELQAASVQDVYGARLEPKASLVV